MFVVRGEKGGLTMRLIDAKQTEKQIKEVFENSPVAMGIMIRWIRKQPTIEAEPVKHGRWVEWWPPKHMVFTGEEVLFRCSNCSANYGSKENMRYCPNCGAKMDLEVVDG
jgi:hypothetical protein